MATQNGSHATKPLLPIQSNNEIDRLEKVMIPTLTEALEKALDKLWKLKLNARFPSEQELEQ